MDVMSAGKIPKTDILGALAPPEPVPPTIAPAYDLKEIERKAREAAEDLNKTMDASVARVEAVKKVEEEKVTREQEAAADAKVPGSDTDKQVEANEDAKSCEGQGTKPADTSNAPSGAPAADAAGQVVGEAQRSPAAKSDEPADAAKTVAAVDNSRGRGEAGSDNAPEGGGKDAVASEPSTLKSMEDIKKALIAKVRAPLDHPTTACCCRLFQAIAHP